MKKLLALALAALMLTACQQAPASQTLAPVTYQAPIKLNVAQITIAETYRPTMQAPYVEHTLPIPPLMAIKQWAGQRLVAAGAQGTLEIAIEDATVKETKLPVKSGLAGFFTDDQEARYDAHIHATLRLYDGLNAISVAEGTVDVARMRTINEKATVEQRERIFHDMVAEMMVQFDHEAEMRLRQYFANFIVG